MGLPLKSKRDWVMLKIVKYPRTYHIEGSRFQPGDEDLDSVPFSAICDRPLIIEEKVDSDCDYRQCHYHAGHIHKNMEQNNIYYYGCE